MSRPMPIRPSFEINLFAVPTTKSFAKYIQSPVQTPIQCPSPTFRQKTNKKTAYYANDQFYFIYLLPDGFFTSPTPPPKCWQ